MSAPSNSGLSVELLLRVIDVKYGCFTLLYCLNQLPITRSEQQPYIIFLSRRFHRPRFILWIEFPADETPAGARDLSQETGIVYVFLQKRQSKNIAYMGSWSLKIS